MIARLIQWWRREPPPPVDPDVARLEAEARASREAAQQVAAEFWLYRRETGHPMRDWLLDAQPPEEESVP